MKKLFLIIILLISQNNKILAQNFEWTKNAGSGGSTLIAEDVSIDVWGNVYAIGTYYSSLTFIDTSVLGNGNNEVYLSKHDKYGNFQWLKTFNASLNSGGFSVETDQLGNIYFSVTFGGSMIVEDTTMFDAFVAKLNPNGEKQWIQHIPATGWKTDLDIDNNNNVYSTFTSNSSGYFGSIYLNNSNPGNDIGVGKFDSDGNALWVKLFNGSGGGRHSFGVSINNLGDLSMAGLFASTSYAAIIDTSNGNTIIEISPLSGTAQAKSILTDDYGNYVVGGIFQGTVNFGSTILNSNGNNDIFIASYDINGNENWVRRIYGSGGNTTNYLLTHMATDQDGNYFVSGSFADIGIFENDTITANGSTSAGFLSKYDFNGNYYWTKKIDPNSGTEIINAIDVTPNGIIAITGNYENTGVIGNDTLQYLGGSKNIFISKFIGNSNLITGSIYIDDNNNGIKDPGEVFSTANYLSDQGFNYHAFTNQDGNYFLQVDTGNFTIIPKTPPYTNIYPPSYNINFSNYGLNSHNNNFRLVPLIVNDLSIDITGLTPARPGFAVTYQITYKNTGTTALSGSISLNFDTLLTIDSISLAPSFQSNDSIAWNYVNLQPRESRKIFIYNHLSATAPLSSVLAINGSIYPIIGDTIPSDNIDTLNQVIVGSYDPNDKSVSPNTDVSLSYVQNENPFEYFIRFQNTGTDTAFNIVVVDTISPLFNLSSFELISSSHNCIIELRNNRRMEFIFNNILLPDSNIDEINSHGFIKYKIKPENTVGIGQEFNNTAYIYFDFNSPIITNTTSNLVYVITNLSTRKNISFNALLFPNPTNQQINYQVEMVETENISFNFYDISGKKVLSRNEHFYSGMNNGSINLSSLSKGIYLVEIMGEGTRELKKLIIK